MKNRKAVAFTGPSNSGKTTLILKVAELLMDIHDLKVAIIKNDPKNKARFDVEGKDSYKFSSIGAEVIVTSPTRTTLFSQKHQEIEELYSLFGDVDIILVEGLKNLPLPRISIFRNSIDEGYFAYMDALAIDDSIDIKEYQLPQNISILDLNDPQMVIEWILKNAKVV